MNMRCLMNICCCQTWLDLTYQVYDLMPAQGNMLNCCFPALLGSASAAA